MNCATVWKIVKKFQETGNTLDQPGRGRKQNVQSPQLLKKREGKTAQSFKMLHRQKLSDNHVAMGAQKCREILQEMGDCTLPIIVFTDGKKFDIQQVINQRNDRVRASSSSTEGRIVTKRQNPQFVMVFVSVTETGRFPLLFEKLKGANTPFSSAPWSVKGVSGLLEILHDLPHH